MTTTSSLPLLAFDWSFHKVHYTFNGIDVGVLPTVDALLETLDRPHRIVAEATFESWDAAGRVRVLEKMQEAGHDFRVYRPFHTARYRIANGIEKSDADDARAIYAIAREGHLHTYRPKPLDTAWAQKRARVNAEYNFIRNTGGKADLIAEAVAVIGPYKQLTEEQRRVLGNGKAYMPSLMAACTFAAKNATSRDEFERLLGMHASGYPSLLRSEIHHQSFKHAHKRGVTWPEFRKQVRWLYSQLKTAGLSNPAGSPTSVK